MLTLLRKIRKSLIDSEATGKPASPVGRYMLYAIGEIALVVIGILIALQINNWNVERMDRRFEQGMLKELLTSLKSDQELFHILLDRMNKKDGSINYILDIIDSGERVSNEEYIDKSGYLGWHLSMSFDRGPYEAIKSAGGLDKIINDSLRSQIIKFYEVSLPRTASHLDELETAIEPFTDMLFEELVDEGLIEYHFVKTENGDWDTRLRMKTEQLLLNPTYLKILRLEMQFSRGAKRRLSGLIQRTENMIDQLENEIE